MTDLYAEVAVNVPVDDLYYYSIPQGMNVKLLQRVIVDLRGRHETGFVIRISDYNSIPDKIKGLKIKPVVKTVEDFLIINDDIIETARWMSNFYLSPFGETLFTLIPSAVRQKRYIHPFKYTGILAELSDDQNKALIDIEGGIGKSSTYLLHGVTGSGKTEIYKHLVKKMLSMGKSSIILIPEISLTPQTMERFYSTFGEEVLIYHSRLSPGERFGEWLRALKGESRVVIGPRSAVFMPVKNLGLIIIDEEHENSYKSGNSPRYHARQVAYHRSKRDNAVLVLGSATPQIESYYYAKKNVFHLVELKKRFGENMLPEVYISDLRNEKNKNIITGDLLGKIIETINKKNQVLIFLNRRGFSTALICRDCGHALSCPNCNIAITYHKEIGKLVCHHCGYTLKLPDSCPFCGSTDIRELGSGTERLENILKNHFPFYRIERMDLDTTRGKSSYMDIIRRMKDHEVDILIGTQMVAKGHDIGGIHFVGVILPDIIMNIPDFRSVERTFVLLTQVIGRAGRREIRGEASIETYMPDHYAIKMAAAQDYEAFYNMEIEKRKAFGYPPFVRLGRIVLRCTDQDMLIEFSNQLKKWIMENENDFKGKTIIMGPVSCPLEKLKNNYRQHIIIKSREAAVINRFISLLKGGIKNIRNSRFVHMEIDIDPLSLI